MEQIAALFIILALYVVLFHEDYAFALKLKLWLKKSTSGLLNSTLKK